EFERAHPDARELLYGVPDLREHAPDLAVAPFLERQLQERARLVALYDGHLHVRGALRALGAPFATLREEDALLELLDRVVLDASLHDGAVGLVHAVARVGQ